MYNLFVCTWTALDFIQSCFIKHSCSSTVTASKAILEHNPYHKMLKVESQYLSTAKYAKCKHNTLKMSCEFWLNVFMFMRKSLSNRKVKPLNYCSFSSTSREKKQIYIIG